MGEPRSTTREARGLRCDVVEFCGSAGTSQPVRGGGGSVSCGDRRTQAGAAGECRPPGDCAGQSRPPLQDATPAGRGAAAVGGSPRNPGAVVETRIAAPKPRQRAQQSPDTTR